MAYDLHGGWESVTGHHAALTETGPGKTLNVVRKQDPCIEAPLKMQKRSVFHILKKKQILK